MGRNGDPRFHLEQSVEGGELELLLRAKDSGGSLNDLRLEATVLSPAAPGSIPLRETFVQTGPGRYKATIQGISTDSTPIAVRVTEVPDSRVVWRGVLPALKPRELSHLGADWETLRELATVTGGRIIRPSDLSKQAFQDQLESLAYRYRPMWSYALAAGLAAMLAGWILGRRGG
jgi:hypothetical protein